MQKEQETKIGILQFAPKLGDIDANTDKINELLQKSSEANIWVLPELASSGYNFSSREEALKYSEKLEESLFIDFLTEKAKELNTWFVSGFNERDGDLLYNSAVLVGPGGLKGHYRKLHLFNREKLFFEPGNTGLPVFETPFGTIGILICFDWMFPEIWRIMSLKGVRLICHPSNLVLPWCQTAMPGHALANRIFIATSNRIGKERDMEFTGQSILVTPEGEYLIRAEKNLEQALIHAVDLKMAENKQVTPFNNAFEDRREDIYSLRINEKHDNLKREKKILRKKIKNIKTQYNEDELKTIGQEAISQLETLPQFKSAKTIFIYWSLPDEVPTHELIEKYRREKRFILPRVVGDHLELREYTGIESLEKGSSFSIQEPTGSVFSDFDSIEMAVVPGIAFTKKGERLGRGGGYYDRTLPFLKKASWIGVAFPFQLVAWLPQDKHDISLDLIITAIKDNRSLDC
jgi:5,10-methenyltetrahydrofolate synthetase